MESGENRCAQASAMAETAPSLLRKRTMGSFRNFRATSCSGARSWDQSATYQVLRRNAIAVPPDVRNLSDKAIARSRRKRRADLERFQGGIVRRSERPASHPNERHGGGKPANDRKSGLFFRY